MADCGSVTEVANRMALTQSGVSRQIAALETELGFALFDRVRGRLAINRRGVAFLSEARRTVDAVELLPRSARAIASDAFDRIRIAATSSIIHGLLPPVLARYVAGRPGLPPSMTMRSLTEIAELDPQDRFDLVFAPLPIRLPRLELVETLSFDLRVAVTADMIHEDGPDIDLRTLQGKRFVSLDPFATYQESIERAFADAQTTVSYVCETSSQLAAARLVALGVGCAFLDPFVADTVARTGIAIRRPSPKIEHAYGVYAPPSTAITAEARTFLVLTRAAVEEANACGNSSALS
ncbi:MAG: LysR family transcriptional regulator [Alphaproteobacteria bacterium]|nr:LysR family transcriptional regulator [Alphaproteobacteria bacterium]